MKLLKETKLGDRVYPYLDSADRICSSPTENTISATVIAIGKRDQDYEGFYILGWTDLDSEFIPENANERGTSSSDIWDYIPNQENYVWGKRVSQNWCVASDNLIVKIKIDGYSCRVCNDYCAFSEPNQKDGTFVCFKCRS